MPQKCNHVFKEKYPYVRVRTIVPVRTKKIMTKNSRRQVFCNTKKKHNVIDFHKEVKIFLVLDTLQQSLTLFLWA